MLTGIKSILNAKINAVFATVGSALALLQFVTGTVGDFLIAVVFIGLIQLRSKI